MSGRGRPGAAVPVLELEEGTPRTIEAGTLTLEDLDWLEASYRRWFEVEYPSPRNGNRTTLRAQHVAGSFPVRDRAVVQVRPKVPVANLLAMLSEIYRVAPPTQPPGRLELDRLEGLQEWLVSILLSGTRSRLRKGLFAAYEPREARIQVARGRVDAVRSLERLVRGEVALHCGYEEHTQDVLENRAVSYTLQRMRRVEGLSEEILRDLGAVARAMGRRVPPRPVRPGEIREVLYHRLNEDYRLLHSLCCLLLECSGMAQGAGGHEGLPFLLDMPRLFERYVGSWLGRRLPPDYAVRLQHKADLEAGGGVAFYIDLVLVERRTGRAVAVLDTKYKQGDSVSTGDIQQAIAYAEKMGVSEAYLVYPRGEASGRTFSGRVIQVKTLAFDLGGDLEAAGEAFLGALGLK